MSIFLIIFILHFVIGAICASIAFTHDMRKNGAVEVTVAVIGYLIAWVLFGYFSILIIIASWIEENGNKPLFTVGKKK